MSPTKGLIASLLFLLETKAFMNLHLNSKLGAIWRPNGKKRYFFSNEPLYKTMTMASG